MSINLLSESVIEFVQRRIRILNHVDQFGAWPEFASVRDRQDIIEGGFADEDCGMVILTTLGDMEIE